MLSLILALPPFPVPGVHSSDGTEMWHTALVPNERDIISSAEDNNILYMISFFQSRTAMFHITSGSSLKLHSRALVESKSLPFWIALRNAQISIVSLIGDFFKSIDADAPFAPETITSHSVI